MYIYAHVCVCIHIYILRCNVKYYDFFILTVYGKMGVTELKKNLIHIK